MVLAVSVVFLFKRVSSTYYGIDPEELDGVCCVATLRHTLWKTINAHIPDFFLYIYIGTEGARERAIGIKVCEF